MFGVDSNHSKVKGLQSLAHIPCLGGLGKVGDGGLGTGLSAGGSTGLGLTGGLGRVGSTTEFVI